jgi:hypothetical protein
MAYDTLEERWAEERALLTDEQLQEEARSAGRRGFEDAVSRAREADTYKGAPMSDDPNAYNVADIVKAIHQGQDKYLYEGDPYQESVAASDYSKAGRHATVSNLLQNPHWGGWETSYGDEDWEGEWSTGYRSHDAYKKEKAYRDRMLRDSNLPVNGAGTEEDGIDWFNMGRWKEALKQTLGNPQNEFIKPKEGGAGYDVNQEALLDLVMSASPMGAIGSLKNVGGLAKAGLRKAVKGGRTKAQKDWASANKETWMNPSQKDEFLREPYDQLDELYNKGGDYVASGKDMISDYLKSIFGGK